MLRHFLSGQYTYYPKVGCWLLAHHELFSEQVLNYGGHA